MSQALRDLPTTKLAIYGRGCRPRPHQQMMDAWSKGSGEVYAAPFAEDGDLIGFGETHFKGRQEIASFHQRLFDTHPKGTRLIGEVTSIRFLSPGVALMYAVGGTVMRGKSTPSPERDSIQTLVATKRGGEWSVAAFQNTRKTGVGLELTLSRRPSPRLTRVCSRPSPVSAWC
jgi:uncharacterized protein (TIGR02246 family)